MDTPTRFSYLFIVGVLVLAGALHLATPLLTTLFGFLALTKLHFFKRPGKWLPVLVFLVLVCGAAYGVAFVVNQSVKSLPVIADNAIPSVIQWARRYQIELPFTDYDSLKEEALEAVKTQVKYLGSVARFAQGAATQFVFLVVGCVVAIGLFLNPRIDRLASGTKGDDGNLYLACCAAVSRRFTVFFESFTTVMGAQVIISAINTVLTGIFALAVGLPYPVVIIGLTFLCGLLPVVGNLASNTIVVGIGFTRSPQMALAVLIFLVVIHKLEYFLNSKIVGWRIHNPLWLTLLALVIGERLLGVPGIILAPVVLNYVRLEASRVKNVKALEPESVEV